MAFDTKQFFLETVQKNIDNGVIRGQEMFQEALNNDLAKSSLLEDYHLAGYVDALLEQYANDNRRIK